MSACARAARVPARQAVSKWARWGAEEVRRAQPRHTPPAHMLRVTPTLCVSDHKWRIWYVLRRGLLAILSSLHGGIPPQRQRFPLPPPPAYGPAPCRPLLWVLQSRWAPHHLPPLFPWHPVQCTPSLHCSADRSGGGLPCGSAGEELPRLRRPPPGL